jgi:hypothetical protein
MKFLMDSLALAGVPWILVWIHGPLWVMFPITMVAIWIVTQNEEEQMYTVKEPKQYVAYNIRIGVADSATVNKARSLLNGNKWYSLADILMEGANAILKRTKDAEKSS